VHRADSVGSTCTYPSPTIRPVYRSATGWRTTTLDISVISTLDILDFVQSYTIVIEHANRRLNPTAGWCSDLPTRPRIRCAPGGFGALLTADGRGTLFARPVGERYEQPPALARSSLRLRSALHRGGADEAARR